MRARFGSAPHLALAAVLIAVAGTLACTSLAWAAPALQTTESPASLSQDISMEIERSASDSDSVAVSAPIRIGVPSVSDFYADGQVHLGAVPAAGYYLTGVYSSSAVGRHICYATPRQGYCWDDGTSGSVRLEWRIREVPSVFLYRTFDSVTGEHLYTSDVSEYRALAMAGWAPEGVLARMTASEGVSSYPVWRLRSLQSGEHLYTSDSVEAAQIGWENEGVLVMAPADTEFQRGWIWRLRDGASGAHLYSSDAAERAALSSQGWTIEGRAFPML